jgi:SAM-dependent methyltransferase
VGAIIGAVRGSTSGHRLNADRRLGAIGAAAYFVLNGLNNARPYANLDPRLAIKPFNCASVGERWPLLPRGASPSRTLSDLFWMTLPWPAIRAALGPIRVLDVGCGSGEYGPRMLNVAAGAIERYTGTDARIGSQWPTLAATDPRLDFFQSKAEHFRALIPAGTNMFVSQSALEHFDEDLAFFDHVRDFIASAGGPVLQVHLVPSQACLRLYLRHGVRQYTPRTLSRATRLFADASLELYALGGRASNRLHWEFITRPLLIEKRDLREVRPDEYDRRLREAIEADMRRPSRSPAFWALVIHSRPTSPSTLFAGERP